MKNLVFFIAMCYISTMFSQEHVSTTIPITDENGGAIYDCHVLIDSDNSLWYTSKTALIKKTGKHQLVYNLNHPKDLKSERGFNLAERGTNEIIGARTTGIFLFDKKTEKIEWIYLPQKERFTSSSRFYIDEKGNIWFGVDSDKVFCYTKDNKLIIDEIETFKSLEDKEGELSIATVQNDGALILKRGNTCYQYSNGTLKKLLKLEVDRVKGKATNLIENGQFFPKNTSGTFVLDGKECSYQYLPEIDMQLYEIPYYRTYGRYRSEFIQNYKGKPILIRRKREELKLLQFKDGKLEVVEQINLDKMGIWQVILKDNTSYIFNLDELVVVESTPSIFQNIPFYSSSGEKLSNVSCRTIANMNGGNIYVATYSGWFLLDKEKDEFHEIRFTEENKKVDNTLSNASYGFYPLNEETFLFYGHSAWVFEMNLKTQTFIRIPVDFTQELSYVDIFDVEAIDKDILLLATKHGLLIYNWQQRRFENDHPRYKELFDLTQKEVRDIYYDKNAKDLWVGLYTNGGLIRKNLETGAMTHFKKEDPQFPLIHNDVLVISLDEKQDLWIGTEGGLQKINTKTLESQEYTFENNLQNKVVGILLENENIWLSTNKGVIRMNRNTEKRTVHYGNNQINNSEFNRKSFLKLNDSTLFFGTTQGMFRVNTNSFSEEEVRDSIVLVQADYYNKREKKIVAKTSGLRAIKEFNIPYAYNYLKLKVAVDHLIDMKTSDFQYRIPELNESWNNIGDIGELNIQGLNPDHYNLEIRAVNSKGFTINTLKYLIQVEQIFYKKPWFIVGVISLIIFLMIIYYKKTQRELELKLKFQRNQTNVLRVQMNPHFIFNALNSVIRKKRNINELKGYILNFAQLMRNTLELGRYEYISIQKILEYQQAFIDFENKLAAFEIEFCIDKPFNFNEAKIEMPSMILQPIIENSIKHAFSTDIKDAKINLSIQKERNYLRIVLRDNGVGYDKNEKNKKTSQGIAILKERIHIWNSLHKTNRFAFEIKKVFQPEVGTEVILKIPYKENMI